MVNKGALRQSWQDVLAFFTHSQLPQLIMKFCNYVKVTYLLCDRLKTLGIPGFGCWCTTFTFVVEANHRYCGYFLASEIDREYLSLGVLLSPDFDLPEKLR